MKKEKEMDCQTFTYGLINVKLLVLSLRFFLYFITRCVFVYKHHCMCVRIKLKNNYYPDSAYNTYENKTIGGS